VALTGGPAVGSELRVVADAWLGTHLGREAFRVDVPDPPPSLDACAAALDDHARRHPGAMYYAKVTTTAIDAVRALGAAGFYVVDVNVTLSRSVDAAPRVAAAGGVVVRPAQPADTDGVLAIAGSAFRYSRFHLDPMIPVATAHALKRAWIESYVNGARGDCLFVALDRDERPVGFLAALLGAGEESAAVIDLIATRSDRQRTGAGTALVGAFFAHYAGRCSGYMVGTQAANVPSLTFYQRLGFAVARTAYVLHKHVPA